MPAKPTPAEQLAQWMKALGTDQSQSADLTKEIDRLKTQIADLSKTVADIDQKGKAWDKGTQPAAQQKSDLATYVKTKTTMLEASVTNKDVVVKAKADALKGLSDLATAVQNAQTTATMKQQAWTAAQTDKATKQAAYDSYAGLAASNDNILKDLAALRAAADKEGASNNVSHMYFLVLVMSDVLQKLNLPSTADYNTELNSRATDLAASSETEKLAKIAADKAAADSLQAQKNLDDATSKWRQQVLDSIPPGGAAPAAAPVAPAAPAVAPAPAVPAPAPAMPPAAAPPPAAGPPPAGPGPSAQS